MENKECEMCKNEEKTLLWCTKHKVGLTPSKGKTPNGITPYKELSKCCGAKMQWMPDGTGEGDYLGCSNCFKSPHQEPVATQRHKFLFEKDREELSACCGARRKINTYSGDKCSKCMKSFCIYPSSTQEPMEWGSRLEKVNGYKFASWTSQKEIKQFISVVIKQAEERHNQDCTREEWARGDERKKIFKEIATIKRWVQTFRDPMGGIEDLYCIKDSDLQAIITNQ